MKEIIDNVFYVYQKILEMGINPLSIILVIFSTHLIKEIFLINNSKYKKLYVLLIALILGCVMTIPFLLLANMLTFWVYITNAIINFFISISSPKIIDIIKEIYYNKIKGEKK